MSYEERAANPCIGAERADLVLAGCAILEAIRRAFPCRAAAGRRPRPARRHAGADDARGRRVGQRRTRGRGVADGKWSTGAERSRSGSRRGKGRHAVLELLARAPAQRSLCRAGQARGLSLARGLQAHRDRRQAPAAQAGRAGRRSRRRARAAGARSPPSASARRGQGPRRRHRPSRDAADRRRRVPAARLPRSRRARQLKTMLGGEADVVLSDMAANTTGHRKTDHLRIMALGGSRRRFRPRGAGARRRLPRQGAAGRHRRRTCSPRSSATSPPCATSSRRPAAPIRPNSTCWRPASAAEYPSTRAVRSRRGSANRLSETAVRRRDTSAPGVDRQAPEDDGGQRRDQRDDDPGRLEISRRDAAPPRRRARPLRPARR